MYVSWLLSFCPYTFSNCVNSREWVTDWWTNWRNVCQTGGSVMYTHTHCPITLFLKSTSSSSLSSSTFVLHQQPEQYNNTKTIATNIQPTTFPSSFACPCFRSQKRKKENRNQYTQSTNQHMVLLVLVPPLYIFLHFSFVSMFKRNVKRKKKLANKE